MNSLLSCVDTSKPWLARLSMNALTSSASEILPTTRKSLAAALISASLGSKLSFSIGLSGAGSS